MSWSASGIVELDDITTIDFSTLSPPVEGLNEEERSQREFVQSIVELAFSEDQLGSGSFSCSMSGHVQEVDENGEPSSTSSRSYFSLSLSPITS